MEFFFFCNYFYNFIAFIAIANVQNVSPIQDGGQKSPPPTNFSSVTSAIVGISAKNLLAFSFNPFATLV